MSDWIVVLHEGCVTAEIPRDRASQERVMFAATGIGSRDEAAPRATGAFGG
jgi:rhamnose transport system ATP-binding protein